VWSFSPQRFLRKFQNWHKPVNPRRINTIEADFRNFSLKMSLFLKAKSAKFRVFRVCSVLASCSAGDTFIGNRIYSFRGHANGVPFVGDFFRNCIIFELLDPEIGQLVQMLSASSMPLPPYSIKPLGT